MLITKKILSGVIALSFVLTLVFTNVGLLSVLPVLADHCVIAGPHDPGANPCTSLGGVVLSKCQDAVLASKVAPDCPVYAEAQSEGKIPQTYLFKNVSCYCVECGECGTEDFTQVVFNASGLILGIAGVAALLMFITGGVYMLISGGNRTYIDRGKLILKSATIGLVIIFAAWIIVNAIVVALTGSENIFTTNQWNVFKF